MKHYYRQHARVGFRFVPVAGLPRKAVIEHVGSNQKYEVPLSGMRRTSPNRRGRAEDAKSGVYRVLMEDSLGADAQGGRRMRTSGVSARRVSPSCALPSTRPPLVNVDSVEVGIEAASRRRRRCLPVKLAARCSRAGVRFRRVLLANGAVKEGPQEDRRYDWYRATTRAGRYGSPADAGAAMVRRARRRACR
jgi:hypothetical protein